MNLILFLTFCSLNFGFIKDSIIIRAGDNSKEVSQFIQESEQNGYQDWAEFLLSAMPDVDLVNLKSDDFIAYFDALKKNFNRVGWQNKIDDNLFYYYILPYRVSQEPLENFTAHYADTLYDLVKNTKNMRDAVFRINEWVYTKMKYEPTEQWDQNATTTIKRGIGRCEEMSILFIKALRTICIPCRHTYTPWWPFTNSNHAWVEVWTCPAPFDKVRGNETIKFESLPSHNKTKGARVDGEWHSLGGGELTDLDNAWFRMPTKRAAIIKSIVYGEINDTTDSLSSELWKRLPSRDKKSGLGNPSHTSLLKEEIIDRKDTKFTIVNSTPNYEDVVELNIQIRKNNVPIYPAPISRAANVENKSDSSTTQKLENWCGVESAQVSINVYNYSSIVPVGSKKTDNNGYVNWVVGKTDLFVYAYKDTMIGYQIWRPSTKTNDTVVINITRREIPDTSFWLYTRKTSGQNPKSKYKPDINKLKKLQDQHFQEINIVDLPLSTTLSKIDTSLVTIFKNSKGNARALLQFYLNLPDSLRDIFVDYFKRLVSKDIVELDTIGLAQELSAILKSISLTDKNTPDSIIKDYVIPSRILYEHIDKWREQIQTDFNHTINTRFSQDSSSTSRVNLVESRGSIKEFVDSVFSWVEHNIEKKKDGDVFGPMMNPDDVYKAKRATNTERYVFIVGILRSQGIPARIKWSFDAVEFWDGQWKEKSFQQKQEKQNVWVGVKFTQDTIDITQKMNYYEDYSVTTFKDNPNRLEPSIDTLNGYQVITLDSEPSYLISGWRNGFGDTYVRLKRFLPTLDTTRIIIKTDIPEDIKPGDLIVREYQGFSYINKLGIKNKELEIGNVLIIIFDINSEASKSTLKNAKDAINNSPGKVYLFAKGSNIKTAQEFLNEIGINYGFGQFVEIRFIRDISEDMYKKWGIQNLPSILYLKNGKTIFWTEGINLHLSRLIQNMEASK